MYDSKASSSSRNIKNHSQAADVRWEINPFILFALTNEVSLPLGAISTTVALQTHKTQTIQGNSSIKSQPPNSKPKIASPR